MPGQTFAFGQFQLDIGSRRLRCNGEAVAVTVKAFDILAALVEDAGRVVDKDELMRRVWPDAAAASRCGRRMAARSTSERDHNCWQGRWTARAPGLARSRAWLPMVLFSQAPRPVCRTTTWPGTGECCSSRRARPSRTLSSSR